MALGLAPRWHRNPHPDAIDWAPNSMPSAQGMLWKRLRERRGRSAPRAVPAAVPGPNADRVPAGSGSGESLVPAARVTQLDLGGHCGIVRPVHGSIVGERFCFQIITGEGSSTFGCSSLAERDQWIESLRRSARPSQDTCERLELALTLWLYEGRELPPGHLLRCQLHLDSLLLARTTAKLPGPNGDLFWGELFQLPSLPPSQALTLSLCREDLPEQPPLASVTIPLSELAGTKQPLEGWYPLSSGASGERAPALRLRGRYREVKVLPIVKYKELAEFITFHYRELCARLEPTIAARHKEELAAALVRVLQSTGKAKAFLIDLGVAELERCHAHQALLFRENTLAAKAIEEYMKLVGAKYLQDTLGEAVAQLCQSEGSCEVDPSRCPNLDLLGNQSNLRQLCQDTFRRIATSCGSFPSELGEVFSAWHEECLARGMAPMGQRLVSASLFLRFLCPAIMSPSLFSLAQQYPSEGTARTLTLVAKVIQNLANFTTFGEKEAYMSFMNDFLAHNWAPMGHFLQAVADPESGAHLGTSHGYVDLALELATLHLLLCDIFSGLDQGTQEELEPLPTILKAIKEGTPVPVSVRLSSATQPSLRRARSREDSPDPPQPPPCPPPCPPPPVPAGHRCHIKRAQSVPAQPKASRCHPRDLPVPTAEDELSSKGRGKLRASASLPRKPAVPWQRQGEEGAGAQRAPEGILGTAEWEKGRWVDALRQEVQQCLAQVQQVDARLCQLQAEQLQGLQQQLEEANARAHNLAARLTAAEGSRRKDLERLKSSEERTRELESRLAALEEEQEQLRDAICRARGQRGWQCPGVAPRGWAEGGDEAQATSV
ncbi:RAS protein activator like-3 [Pogoniulus pusillus]|uniref:RAS protein activator like-3 n=1 Tax=Pogoniulus pusillus TaxID=488313 RepID=UPI0030B95287